MALVLGNLDLAMVFEEGVASNTRKCLPVRVRRLIDDARVRDCYDYAPQFVCLGVLKCERKAAERFATACRDGKTKDTGLPAARRPAGTEHLAAHSVDRRFVGIGGLLIHGSRQME